QRGDIGDDAADERESLVGFGDSKEFWHTGILQARQTGRNAPGGSGRQLMMSIQPASLAISSARSARFHVSWRGTPPVSIVRTIRNDLQSMTITRPNVTRPT